MPDPTGDELRLRAKVYRVGCFLNLGLLLVLVTLIVAGWLMIYQRVKDTESHADEPAIRQVLDDQVAAWNRGDLDGFMAGYWRDDSLLFTSGDKITKGWNDTRQRYVDGYFGPKPKYKERGELSFGELQVESLSHLAAVVRGRYFLKVAKGTATGRFTLTFRKLADGWKITSDHTSVDPEPKEEKPAANG